MPDSIVLPLFLMIWIFLCFTFLFIEVRRRKSYKMLSCTRNAQFSCCCCFEETKMSASTVLLLFFMLWIFLYFSFSFIGVKRRNGLRNCSPVLEIPDFCFLNFPDYFSCFEFTCFIFSFVWVISAQGLRNCSPVDCDPGNSNELSLPFIFYSFNRPSLWRKLCHETKYLILFSNSKYLLIRAYIFFFLKLIP